MAQKIVRRKNTTKASYGKVKGLTSKVKQVEDSNTTADLGKFKPGDTVKVSVRIKEGEKERVQGFEGVCIARQNRGAGKSFTVRKMSHGVGVERIFQENSPKVAKVEVLQAGAVRRAKLYYLRGLEGRAARIDREDDTTSAK